MTTGALDWIILVLLGGLLGLLGQSLRAIAGLKKASDQALYSNQTFAEVFDWKTLLTSLLIGFTAGAVAALLVNPAEVKTPVVLGLLAAGYAGTDFIEAFVRRNIPNSAGHMTRQNQFNRNP